MEAPLKASSARVAIFVSLAIIGIACIAYGTYQLGYSTGYHLKETELKECAHEVSSGCPNVTTYAIMLEKENARLNKACKRKTQKDTD